MKSPWWTSQSMIAILQERIVLKKQENRTDFVPHAAAKCFCKYRVAMATLLQKQKPIACSRSAWWPGGRIHAKPFRTLDSATLRLILPSIRFVRQKSKNLAAKLNQKSGCYTNGILCILIVEVVVAKMHNKFWFEWEEMFEKNWNFWKKNLKEKIWVRGNVWKVFEQNAEN